jgi:hypothetical protein
MNKKILKEERSKRLKSELLRIGVFQAKKMGLSIEDFINIVFEIIKLFKFKKVI